MNISAEEFHIHFISYANIPFKAGIYASDLSIDWGDGTSSILKEKQYFNIVHHYQQEGLFHIKISGHRISNLNVSRLNLVDLQLEHCPSLEYLNCSINECIAIPIIYKPWISVPIQSWCNWMFPIIFWKPSTFLYALSFNLCIVHSITWLPFVWTIAGIFFI